MLVDFCFKNEYHAKIGKLQQKNNDGTNKNNNIFKNRFIFVIIQQISNVNF